MTGTAESPSPTFALSRAVIPLLRGVVYRERDDALWNGLIHEQARVRDYVAVLGLELVLDGAEGYAFLRSRPDDEAPPNAPTGGDTVPEGARLPRLVVRRPLSFQVSLLLALLRRKLAETDAGGGDTRVVLTRDEIVEMVRVFWPDTSNEARLIDRIDAHLNRVVELGFLRRMRAESGGVAGTGAQSTFEVRRILKAFVDAQWLAEFDARLAQYRAVLEGTGNAGAGERRQRQDGEGDRRGGVGENASG